ncbi:MAG: alanine--tRNA ligase-related protein, partial [Clostridia bacterium]
MESYNSNKIKEEFISYANSSEFKYCVSDSIVASSDSRLLFNISGGVKYQEELLGKKETQEKKVASIQSCIRTDNMEGIGYTGRHHLFFEMLGHFMFYSSREYECKNEFINFAYNYLTQIIGLDKNRIFATIHPEDTISQNIWKRIGNSNLILNDNNFFVSPYAEKSALRTEILWQKNDEQ